MAYLLLAASIIFEVFGSTMLKLSDGFKKVLPIVGVILGYGICFYALSLTLKALPLGLVYATWSGVGTILTAVIGVMLFQDKITKKGFIGIGFLVIGLVLMNISK
ncbi:small multidrug resistance pump/multidrug resistance protein EbrA [Terribacillus halophilus]|uniref:Small multidrug resistance pump/multidrug resistance protein EbrA n=1 Tax=Terribacillus halophilus TaxID=361279 RepID=A0A1G6T3D2_9BACI|nr:multidrug efflux SMR transporter [Terribacillus halophilus]SDD22875.1 small multidrug resistance pump/multidrug resistance protein EbrA [Terribacillus halophilus]